MCSVAAAVPDLYLSASQPARPADCFPTRELEFDVRGRVEVAGSWAHCETGETKAGADFGTAIRQLGVRLKVLAWVVSVTQGRDDLDVTLVGRLFMRGTPVGGASETKIAADKWGYSLYIHGI